MRRRSMLVLMIAIFTLSGISCARYSLSERNAAIQADPVKVMIEEEEYFCWKPDIIKIILKEAIRSE